jgi:hypothetical protein
MALVVAGLSLALMASGTTQATATPKAPRVAPKPGNWTTTTTGCPAPDGTVQSKSLATLLYPTSKVYLAVIVVGHVNDSAVLGPSLQVTIKMRHSKVTKDVIKTENVSTKANGAPAFTYTLSFAKSTTTLTRKAVAAEVADALARARKQETIGRNLLLKAQALYWGSPGKCVTASVDPNNFSVVPKDSGTTTGKLVSLASGNSLAGNWKLVKAYIGKISNPTQQKQTSPDFQWTAAAQADTANNLVKVTLRATSKEGLDDVTLVITKQLGKVQVEVDLAFVGDVPQVSPNDIGNLTFGATLSFDATEQPGMPGVYALDGDANWSFPVKSVTLAPGSDCLDTTITSFGTSSPFNPGVAPPDMPAGDTDVIQLDPSNQWRLTPTFGYFILTTETIPPTNPNNCQGNDYWGQQFNGMVDVPPPFGQSGNYLDTVLPNGDLNTTQTVKWTRDLGGLSMPLLTGGISATVNVTPLPNP